MKIDWGKKPRMYNLFHVVKWWQIKTISILFMHMEVKLYNPPAPLIVAKFSSFDICNNDEHVKA